MTKNTHNYCYILKNMLKYLTADNKMLSSQSSPTLYAEFLATLSTCDRKPENDEEQVNAAIEQVTLRIQKFFIILFGFF